MSESKSKYNEKLTRAIGEALDYAGREPVLLVRMEEFFSSKPASLASSSDEEKNLIFRVGTLCQTLGGPPKIVILKPGEEPPNYETFPTAAIDEILSCFHRCRRSVCRTQVCLIGSEFYKTAPEALIPVPEPSELKSLQNAMGEMFWEHAETSYLRLASFWDRIGQLLDFVFFNIRQYERDGFPAVVDRIRSNYVPMFHDIDFSEHWTNLWNYQRSENTDGLRWLIRRRNLLVHSLHLEAIQAADDKENAIFTSAFNHLDESVRKKLKPETPKSELECLHAHLSAAARLFSDVLGLCELRVRLRGE